jgi:ADP-ribosylglycohydrolase
MSKLNLETRIQGALTGAAIGAELAFARAVNGNAWSAVKAPDDLFTIDLKPALDWKPEPHNQSQARQTPVVALGVRAFVEEGGRVTPEAFAAKFKEDPGVATPAFAFDGLHTAQELLKEGMHPRLGGLHNAPSGLIAAAMPAVGIFHFADPERAYLDGVELASVAQPRLGADWAGLSAAAVAAAFESDATPDSVVSAVLRSAQANCKDLFYQLNTHSRGLGGCKDDATIATWWCTQAGVVPSSRDTRWVAPFPIRYALPLLNHYHDQPQKLMQLLVGVNPGEWWGAWWIGVHAASAVIAGAVMGALHGPQVFPKAWLQWATPIARPWFKLNRVVANRMAEEKIIVHEIETLADRKTKGPSKLHDKIKGAMLAGAIGNAMGSPVEGKMYREIDKQYPEHVLTVLDPKRLESEDDNQMAMHLVETYIERDGLPVMARHFGKTWHDHLNRDHFFPLCMGNAYDLIRAGEDPRIIGHWSVVTGSTVMCLEPVGIFNLADPAWAAQDATAVAYMYQRGLDVTAAAMLAATTANALRVHATVESVLQAALDAAPRTPLVTFDKRKFRCAYDYIATCLDVADKYDDVLAAREELYKQCLFYHMIDPLELWGLALAMFKIAKGDVRQAAIGGTNIGRDSDTIAGRAAMLSGALKGTAGVPKEWIAMFSQASMERIDRNAARLTELISVKKLAHLQARRSATGEKA